MDRTVIANDNLAHTMDALNHLLILVKHALLFHGRTCTNTHTQTTSDTHSALWRASAQALRILFLSLSLSFFLSVPLSFFLCACLSLSLSLSAWHITQGKEGAARHRMTGAIGECHVCDRRQLADMNLVQVKLGENFALKPCPTQDTDRCVPQFAFWNLRGTR